MNSVKNGSTFIRPSRVAGVVLSGLGLVALSLGSPAYAADENDVEVVNTETVQVYMDAEGKVDSRRVYEQLTLIGEGSVEVVNPIEETGLRNLDGFTGFDVANGKQMVSTTVNGVERLRSVSDFGGDLPLDVKVEYLLDGKAVDASDIVGESGELEVRYTVENVTGVEQTVSFPDGKGGLTSETIEVPIPIVGSLTTVAPPNFTNVQSQQANLAGDGKGGTKLSFTMTLFPPIGSPSMEFGYTATITDGVVPGSSISALPVNPLESVSFRSAGKSYESGSATGLQLAMGASTIDENLLKLRDGSADLLAGLIKLSDGADELNAGLSGEAAPGARRLASGALQLDDGLGQLDDGAGKLAAGAGRLRLGAGQLDDGADELSAGAGKLNAGARQLSAGAGTLSAGTGDAVTGSEKLEGGLKLISEGLSTLADAKSGLPTTVAGADALKAGVNQILAGFGSTTQPDTLLFGLQSLEVGLGQLQAGATQLGGGLQLMRGDAGAIADPLDGSGLAKARNATDVIKAGLDSALAPANGPTTPGGGLEELRLGLENVRAQFCATHPTLALQCTGTVNALLDGVAASRADLGAASGGLGQISIGLGDAVLALDNQLIPGANQLTAGLATAKDGAIRTKAGAIALRGGAAQVGGGLDQLKAGLVKAVAGVLQLNTGAGTAYTGSGQLSDGLVLIDGGADRLAKGAGDLAAGTGKLSSGAKKLAGGTQELRSGSNKLATGAGQLSDGATKAADGSGQLADGAGELADGLGDAADGSGLLADGLDKAAGGAPQIVDGAGRLSDEGMSMLISAGEDTAQNYGKLYAVMKAGAARADVQKMAYGAPDGAQGLTAYSFELVGDDGESGRNATRGLAALVLLGAGLAALGLRRRFA